MVKYMIKDHANILGNVQKIFPSLSVTLLLYVLMDIQYTSEGIMVVLLRFLAANWIIDGLFHIALIFKIWLSHKSGSLHEYQKCEIPL